MKSKIMISKKFVFKMHMTMKIDILLKIAWIIISKKLTFLSQV
jgi:hypothetical protein